jgi:hypothetical protein
MTEPDTPVENADVPQSLEVAMWSRNIMILAAGTLLASPAFAQQQKTQAPAAKPTASASSDSTHAAAKRKHRRVSRAMKSGKSEQTEKPGKAEKSEKKHS